MQLQQFASAILKSGYCSDTTSFDCSNFVNSVTLYRLSIMYNTNIDIYIDIYPYGKLWTEFFPSFYGPSAKRAGHENKEGKNEDP